jgi:YggT family protein
VALVKIILTYALWIFLVLLIGRLIINWIQSFSRDWKPTGLVLVLAEACFTPTDPPLRLLRRYIRPVRLGRVALDLSFMLLFLVVFVLIRVVQLI